MRQALRTARAGVFTALCVDAVRGPPRPALRHAAAARPRGRRSPPAVFLLAFALAGRERGYGRIAALLVPLELAADTVFTTGQHTCYGAGRRPGHRSAALGRRRSAVRRRQVGAPAGRVTARGGAVRERGVLGPLGAGPRRRPGCCSPPTSRRPAAAAWLRRGEAALAALLRAAAGAAFRPLLVRAACRGTAAVPGARTRAARAPGTGPAHAPLLTHSVDRRGPPAPASRPEPPCGPEAALRGGAASDRAAGPRPARQTSPSTHDVTTEKTPMSKRNNQAAKRAARERLRPSASGRRRRRKVRRQLIVGAAARRRPRRGRRHRLRRHEDERAQRLGGGEGRRSSSSPPTPRARNGTTVVVGKRAPRRPSTSSRTCAARPAPSSSRPRATPGQGHRGGKYKLKYTSGTFIDGNLQAATGSKNALSALGAALNVSQTRSCDYKTRCTRRSSTPRRRKDKFADDSYLLKVAAHGPGAEEQQGVREGGQERHLRQVGDGDGRGLRQGKVQGTPTIRLDGKDVTQQQLPAELQEAGRQADAADGRRASGATVTADRRAAEPRRGRGVPRPAAEHAPTGRRTLRYARPLRLPGVTSGP